MSTATVNKTLIGIKDILSETAKWIVFQSPYVPEQLCLILVKIKERLEASPEFIAAEIKNMGFIEMDYNDLLKWLKPMFEEIPEYMDLNLSKTERDKGIAVDDESRPAFVGSSRYDKLKDEHEFVDLDALIWNICKGIIEKS